MQVVRVRFLWYSNAKNVFCGGMAMNIQIFGTNKSFDTKKAQRWFKERGI